MSKPTPAVAQTLKTVADMLGRMSLEDMRDTAIALTGCLAPLTRPFEEVFGELEPPSEDVAIATAV